jgi:farnesyl-diphosphate farnesyltransferase
MDVLEATSRTFFIPISQLPPGLLEAVGSAYLCMRAIDEIEDHPILDNLMKAELLRKISQALQSSVDGPRGEGIQLSSSSLNGTLPEVTLRLAEWIELAPSTIAPRIWDATAAMSDRMAYWAENNWEIHTEYDLDRYTFSVAGTVGLLLSDLWSWYDGTKTDRLLAVGFGRGLQAVNILRNRSDDISRGVDFFPDDWSDDQMHRYARRNLGYADAYLRGLTDGPALNFCKIPFVLAQATIDALARGEQKLSRGDVLQLIDEAAGK